MTTCIKLGSGRLAAAGLVALLVALLGGCGAGDLAVQMDYVPDAGSLQQHLPELIVTGAKPEGIYANRDVDSRLFRYALPKTGTLAAQALKGLEAAARKQGWQVRDRSSHSLRLNRFDDTLLKKGGSFSVEEARIVIDDRRVVTVGWVQADPSGKVERFEEARDIADWAEQVIWKRMPPATGIPGR